MRCDVVWFRARGREGQGKAYHDIVFGEVQVLGVVHQTEVGDWNSAGGKA